MRPYAPPRQRARAPPRRSQAECSCIRSGPETSPALPNMQLRRRQPPPFRQCETAQWPSGSSIEQGTHTRGGRGLAGGMSAKIQPCSRSCTRAGAVLARCCMCMCSRRVACNIFQQSDRPKLLHAQLSRRVFSVTMRRRRVRTYSNALAATAATAPQQQHPACEIVPVPSAGV
jgi:hypothetical protein